MLSKGETNYSVFRECVSGALLIQRPQKTPPKPAVGKRASGARKVKHSKDFKNNEVKEYEEGEGEVKEEEEIAELGDFIDVRV